MRIALSTTTASNTIRLLIETVAYDSGLIFNNQDFKRIFFLQKIYSFIIYGYSFNSDYMNSQNYTIVNIVINRPIFKEFAYKVNSKLSHEHIGARVAVNFAGSKMVGIITTINPKIDFDEKKLKSAQLLDNKGIIPNDIFKIIEFGSAYYQYPVGQCFNVALPKLLRECEPFSYEAIPALSLTTSIDEDKVNKIKSDEQKQILKILENGAIKRKELRERGFTSASENALIKKGLVQKIDLEIVNERFTDSLKPVLKEEPPLANIEQQNAILQIANTNVFQTFLLNGITGSGKTEVYLRIIEKVLKKKKAVLVLVPEIALTPQTFERFYRRFNVPVSSMHSALSDRERLDAYIDMATSKAGILIGTRTALFTPIPNLGLIVIDEEHDSSFKQSDTFRYHARTMAIMRAKINDCPIILGSATPSLETIYNVQRGLITKIDLTVRAGGAQQPDFELIDLCKEPLSEGLKTGICQTLENAIGEETAKGNQVLLFLNRRGYSHHLVCHNCGHVFVCPHCDNLLTVHKKNHKLQCHICENTIPIPNCCPKCGNEQLFEQGFGTEQVCEFLQKRYPDVGVERIDRDSVTTKAQLESRLENIRSGKSKIMLGTQMLAKGHDFPDVTLVGILDVDSSLFSDDYRSLETTAQLLTQVSGRSGRGKKKGRVFIQSHHIDNLLINQIVDPQCNYLTIAKGLLDSRKNLCLPPYTSQAFLLCNSANRQKAHSYIMKISEMLNSIKGNYPNLAISSVLSDKIEKQQNRYHFHMLVTCSSRNTMSLFLANVRNLISENNLPQDVRFALEVDPIIMY